MKALVVAFCLLLQLCLAKSDLVVTREFTKEVAKSVEWEVVDYEDNIFKGWTGDDILSFLGTSEIGSVPIVSSEDEKLVSDALPENFDAREKWKHCIHPIRHQGKCASCWAHGSTEALSDRFCIEGHDVILSPQDLVSCDHTSHACSGGSIGSAYTYMEHSGVVTDSCFPYVSADFHIPACPTKCPASGVAWVKHKCKAGSVAGIVGDVEKMKAEISTRGPITCFCQVYEDLMLYKGGIYSHKAGRLITGHIMKALGWGIQGGVHYWIIANSWGNTWGESGYMKFKMHDCEIDNIMTFCAPHV